MTPGLLFDVSIKLNFWVVDRINRLTNLLPQLRQAFEPLARSSVSVAWRRIRLKVG